MGRKRVLALGGFGCYRDGGGGILSNWNTVAVGVSFVLVRQCNLCFSLGFDYLENVWLDN